MQLLHVIAKDEEKKSVTISLYGEIGSKLDGDYFAQELNYLGKEYDEIVIRINSGGGSVLQGLSVFNAILNSPAYTIAHIEGIAASMAGVIPMAADKVIMNDFARIMVHNPFYPDSKNLTNKEKKALEHLSDMLTQLLSRRGVEATKMADFMAKETWFTADEALELKLIDEIINTGRKEEANNRLQDVAALSTDTFQDFLQSSNQQKDMKILASIFGLAAEAGEADIVAKVKDLQAENDTLKATNQELKELSDKFKAEKEAAVKAEIESLVVKAVKDGFFAEDVKDSLIAEGIKNPESMKTMLNSLKKPAASLSAALAAAGDHLGGAADEKKDFHWYQKNDPEALAEMEKREPEKFQKLYDAYLAEV